MEGESGITDLPFTECPVEEFKDPVTDQSPPGGTFQGMEQVEFDRSRLKPYGLFTCPVSFNRLM